MTSSTKDYAVRPVDLQIDGAAVASVWRGHVLFSPEHKFDWFYVRSPYPVPTLLLLTHGAHAAPVGVGGLGARCVCVQGEAYSAGILVDLVVLPEHRSLYPAMLLQKQMRQVALGMHAIVYGLTNKNSTPIVKRLGYVKATELTRYVRVLRHGSYLAQRVPSVLGRLMGAVVDRLMPWYLRPYRAMMKPWMGSWDAHFDGRFDALWQRARSFAGLMGVRDAQFLNWRFLQQPDHQYRCFTVTDPDTRELVAYAVCEAEGSVLHVRDFLVDPQRGDMVRVLYHLLAQATRQQGFQSLSVEFSGSFQQRSLLGSAGLYERGHRPVYATFAPAQLELMQQVDWYMTSADED